MAYTLESILAEKYETILRRNIGTTRARDFYDLHTLYRLRQAEICPEVLKAAVESTAVKRGSIDELAEWAEIVKEMHDEAALRRLWENYAADNSYAATLSFDAVLDTVLNIAKLLSEE